MDLTLLPDIFALAVFIFAFRPLVRRAGAHADVWFLGWSFLLIHSAAVAFLASPGPLHSLLQLVAIWATDLCGLSFFFVAANVPVRRIETPVVFMISIPVLLQSAAVVLHNPFSSLSYLSSALYAIPGIYMLVTGRRRHQRMIVVAIAFLSFAILSEPFAAHAAPIIAACTLTLLFSLAAYLYCVAAPRYTRGIFAVVFGLATWAFEYPLLAFLTRVHPEMRLQHTLLVLPQYVLAAGMLLSMLEEHVLRTERMAMHDPLTDLPNRRLFEERLVATMEEARMTRTTIACLVIDVDNFKAINDSLGHEAGDQLLRALAVRLSWHMSPRDILARTGGDEFTALLAGVNDEHHLRFIAGAMMSAASVPVIIDGKPVDVRISVGIALSPDDADDIDSLRRAADEAMYSAKRRGGSLLAFAGKE